MIGTKWGAGDGSKTFQLPDVTDRVLEGTTDGTKVGTYLEAGLPNITGALLSTRSYGKTTGAFYEGDGRGYVHDERTDKGIVAFSASRSSSQYGESSTVQPPAFQALIIIKV